MRVDKVLQEYRKTNLNSYFRSQHPTSSTRLLLEMQNDKSLFLRDQPPMYLIQWALVPATIIAMVWASSIVIYLMLQCCYSK